MEEGKKKLVMIIVIVLCLGVAGAIFFGTGGGGGGGIDDISDAEMTWMKCRSCNAEYQTSLKEYYKYVTANANPMAPSAPPMPCEKCGKAAAFKAEKCQNPACGIVFQTGSVPNDFPDRCPKCKQSATEESRNARKREMAGG